MTADPKISVVSACYNHGKYIHEMIDSVMNQTFRDFEIIIVNDGSTDDTREILDAIKNEKIQVIHTEKNGPSIARNIAIDKAKSDIIFNLDADDKIASDFLQKAYDVFSKNEQVGIVFTESIFFGHRTRKMHLGEYSLESMLKSNRIVSAACFKKADWKIVGGYSKDFIYGLEDWDLWLSIIELGRVVIKIPDSCFYYRTYPRPSDSRSGRRNSDRSKALEAILMVFRRHQQLYSKYPEISERFSRYENESELTKKVANLIFSFKYRMQYLLN